MIVDIHTHPTNFIDPAWRHIPPTWTGERLLKHMDGPFYYEGQPRSVDMAVIQPAIGATVWSKDRADWSFREQHEYIIELVKKYPKRFIGCMTINPRFGVEDGLKELERLVREHSFRMVKLHPNMHAYRIDRATDYVTPIMEKCIKLKIPVLIHTGDTPFSIPSLLFPVIETFPDAIIILAHFGTQMISYAYELMYLAKKNDNVLLETGWGPPPRLVEAVSMLGAERLVFGSDTPPNEMGAWIRMIEVLGWEPPQGARISREDREKILGDNIAKIMGIT